MRANITYSRLKEISRVLGVSVIDLSWPEKYVVEAPEGECADCKAKDTTIANLNKYIELLEQHKER